jgi:hypothetical protein
MTGDRLTLDGYIGDAPALYFRQEIRVGVGSVAMGAGAVLEQIEQGRQEHRDDDPEDQILTEIHCTIPSGRKPEIAPMAETTIFR